MELSQWMKPAQNEFRIYPWNVSTMGLTEDALVNLRDADVSQLVALLESASSSDVKSSAQIISIVELVTHGYWEKAALLTRELVRNNKEIRKLIREYLPGFERKLLRDRISSLPKNPDDFPNNIKKIFIQ